MIFLFSDYNLLIICLYHSVYGKAVIVFSLNVSNYDLFCILKVIRLALALCKKTADIMIWTIFCPCDCTLQLHCL